MHFDQKCWVYGLHKGLAWKGRERPTIICCKNKSKLPKNAAAVETAVQWQEKLCVTGHQGLFQPHGLWPTAPVKPQQVSVQGGVALCEWGLLLLLNGPLFFIHPSGASCQIFLNAEYLKRCWSYTFGLLPTGYQAKGEGDLYLEALDKVSQLFKNSFVSSAFENITLHRVKCTFSSRNEPEEQKC